MNEQMEFPETFEGFAKEYGFKDDKEVYTNGSDLIPIFRVKQWLEHDKSLEQIKWEDIDKEEILKSVVLLDLFTKTYCRYINDYERFDDLRFRCSECPFGKDNGECLVKLFKNKYAPDYHDFGSMGDL